jgi:hypothetical protein
MRIVTTALLMFAIAPREAAAQSRPISVFVEGAFLEDHDPTRFGPTGTRPGGGVTLGLMVSPRYSLRFDLEIPDWYTTTDTFNNTVGDHIEVNSHRQGDRTIAYAMLVGRHYQPYRGLALTLAAGVTSTEREGRSTGFTELRSREGAILRHSDFDQHWGDQWLALTLGLDAEFVVMPHLAIVPEVRLHTYPPSDSPASLITRPRIAVRWRF